MALLMAEGLHNKQKIIPMKGFSLSLLDMDGWFVISYRETTRRNDCHIQAGIHLPFPQTEVEPAI